LGSKGRTTKLTRLLFIAIAASLALTSLSPAVASDEACWTSTAKERSLAKKTNKARAKAGLAKLNLDPELSFIARRNSRRMAKKGKLVHTANLGGKVTQWKLLGENVGYGVSVSQLHTMFMSSPTHKDNILTGSFRHVGVGLVKKGEYLWVTVVFESKKNPGTTLNMPSC
jgi:uncharacterized protein YkwD